jgi:Fe2+ transport system protein FeoA
MSVDVIARQMYATLQNHRAVYTRLIEMGVKRGTDFSLLHVMLWCDLITPEMWVRINSDKA